MKSRNSSKGSKESKKVQKERKTEGSVDDKKSVGVGTDEPILIESSSSSKSNSKERNHKVVRNKRVKSAVRNRGPLLIRPSQTNLH